MKQPLTITELPIALLMLLCIGIGLLITYSVEVWGGKLLSLAEKILERLREWMRRQREMRRGNTWRINQTMTTKA